MTARWSSQMWISTCEMYQTEGDMINLFWNDSLEVGCVTESYPSAFASHHPRGKIPHLSKETDTRERTLKQFFGNGTRLIGWLVFIFSLPAELETKTPPMLVLLVKKPKVIYSQSLSKMHEKKLCSSPKNFFFVSSKSRNLSSRSSINIPE